MKGKLREHNSGEPKTDVLFHLYLITIWQDYLHIRLHLDDVISVVQFSRSAVSSFLWPRGRQQTRLPCPSPTPWACSNSCPLSGWCHPTISFSVVPFSSCLQSLPASGSFPELVLCIRWPKYLSFSFSISPSNEYSGLTSFRMDCLDLLVV